MKNRTLSFKMFTHTSVLLVITLLSLLLNAGATQAQSVSTGKAQAASPQQRHCGWSVILDDWAGRGGAFAEMRGVFALSNTYAWAIGHSDYQGNQSYILRWYGVMNWHYDNAPNIGTLNSVTAISTKNAWTVGSGGPHGTLTEHWNGSGWRVVPSPGSNGSSLSGVAATSANDVWAVGGDGANHTLIEHWNGSQWSIVHDSARGMLNGVAALSSSDAWAVGYTGGKTLIEHWNGSQWSISATTGRGTLTAVAADPAGDVWADGNDSQGKTFVERWTGQMWQVVPSPNRHSPHLNSIAVVSTNDVWAVGYYHQGGNGEAYSMQWNGKQWKELFGHSPNGGQSSFASVARVPGTSELMAVGYSFDNGPYQDAYLLAEYYFCL